MNIVPLTIWREARGEGRDGMIAVAFVIRNRALLVNKQWPDDPERVCLQKKQFSCWNDSDPQRDLYPNETDLTYNMAQQVWDQLIVLHDPTGEATFYLNPKGVSRNPFDDPQFVKTAEIGNHWFYKKG